MIVGNDLRRPRRRSWRSRFRVRISPRPSWHVVRGPGRWFLVSFGFWEVFLGLVWLEIGIAGAWYVARRAQPAADSHWRHILSQLLAQCGFRRPMEVRRVSAKCRFQ